MVIEQSALVGTDGQGEAGAVMIGPPEKTHVAGVGGDQHVVAGLAPSLGVPSRPDTSNALQRFSFGALYVGLRLDQGTFIWRCPM